MFLETLATEEEKASFTRIYELYCSTMYHYALGILSNKEVRSYLYMTVRSVCFDALRRRRTANQTEVGSIDELDLVSVGDDGFEKRPSDIEKQFPVIRRRIHL